MIGIVWRDSDIFTVRFHLGAWCERSFLLFCRPIGVFTDKLGSISLNGQAFSFAREQDDSP